MAIALTSSKTTEEVETVELFSIDGVSYHIPTKPRVNVALKYLKMARDEGTDAAAAFLLEKLLGEEAYNALMDFDDLTDEALGQIVEAAQKVTLGGLEAPKA